MAGSDDTTFRSFAAVATGKGATSSVAVVALMREANVPACGKIVLVRTNPVVNVLASFVEALNSEGNVTELAISKEIEGWRIRGNEVAEKSFPLHRAEAVARMLSTFDAVAHHEFGLTQSVSVAMCSASPGLELIDELLAQAYRLNTLLKRLQT